MQKAAILVNNAERLREGLRAGHSLALKGVQVQILLTDPTTAAADSGEDDAGFNRGQRKIRRYTNRLDIAGRLGFRHATLLQIAVMLKEADFVIPF